MLFLATGCAALLFFGGGHYLLSRTHLVPDPSPQAPQHTSTQSRVLGSSTKTSDVKPQATDPNPAAPAASATTTAPVQTDTSTTATTKSGATIKVSATPSFEINIDSSKIRKSGLNLTVPFSVERQGGLSTPIVPGDVSVTCHGMVVSVTVSPITITAQDTGVIVMVPVCAAPNTLSGHFSASSGSLSESADFSYKL
jgi:hypothetical protein